MTFTKQPVTASVIPGFALGDEEHFYLQAQPQANHSAERPSCGPPATEGPPIIELDDGREVTAHCANPGAMLGLNMPGLKVWVEPNDDPKKKLKYGWRLVEFGDAGGNWAGIDTAVPNRVVGEALRMRRIPEFVETPFGTELCGWDGHQLIFHVSLPDGLTVRHRMTVAPDRQQLHVATTVTSTAAPAPFTLNRVYQRFEPLPSEYDCEYTLSKKKTCSTRRSGL